jgi:hypothetical protein
MRIGRTVGRAAVRPYTGWRYTGRTVGRTAVRPYTGWRYTGRTVGRTAVRPYVGRPCAGRAYGCHWLNGLAGALGCNWSSAQRAGLSWMYCLMRFNDCSSRTMCSQ